MKSLVFLSGGTAAALSLFCKKYSPSCQVRRLQTFQKYTLTDEFKYWSEKWFHNVQLKSPVFQVPGKNIKVLYRPEEFFEELIVRSGRAKERIAIASLYLGNGEKEAQLIDAIHENLQSLKKPANVNILLEYTRGSRGTKNSRTMLLPLLKDFTNTTNIALFHTPNLRGLLRAIVPERFNETINVAHLKVYLFDDTLIMSGANLSHDYFTNRQDRYIVFDNCKELCDYYEDLVKTISKFSFQLQPNDTVELHKDFSHHPYEGSKSVFNEAAGKLLREFQARHINCNNFENILEFSNDSSNSRNTSTNSSNKDTLVFPLLQMRTMGITQDEEVTRNILQFAPTNTDMTLATAYFNLTNDYWDAIVNSAPNVDLLMAHPKAMGFYKAPGMAGGIPNAYSLISKRRLKSLIRLKETDRIKFLEFHRDGWTFHGKGLWAYLRKTNTQSDILESPLVTLIGSPNFGKRSVYRDMESQVAVITLNNKLKRQLLKERDNMVKDTTPVVMETFKEEDRRVYWWVYLIATFMNELF